MKKGTGDDPFADEPAEDTASDPNAKVAEEQEPSTEDSKSTATVITEPSIPKESEEQETSSSTTTRTMDLPYLARRQLKNKSVKSDRDQVPFFLRTTVQHGERDLRRAVEDSLNQEINKTDLREAAYVFAQQHPEGVAEVLREWGIEYLE